MRILLTALVLAATALLPSPAIALDLFEARAPFLQVAQNDGMSLSQAIESVRQRTGGKVLSAETRVQGGREVHHIKVLTKDGKVKTHKVNGRRR
jgi:uncharacterized membrane protein YkoI